MTYEDVQKKIAALVIEGEGIAAKSELKTTDQERLEAIVAEVNGLKSQGDALKKMGDLSAWAGQSAGVLPVAANRPGAEVVGFRPDGHVTVENETKALLVNDEGTPIISEKAWKAIQTPEYKQAFKSYLRRGKDSLSSDAIKTLQEGDDESGGFLVPADLLNRLISKEPAPQTVASRVTQLNTSRDALTIPKVTYTANNKYTTGMRVTWTGEIPASATVANVTQPTFGQVRVPVWTAMMRLPITNDMIEDASYNLLGWTESKFGETYNLLKEDMIINGTGVLQPKGIIANPGSSDGDEPVYVASSVAAALTADGIIDLAFALPEQYDRNAVMVLNKTSTGKAIAKLKDGDGRYLLGSGLADNGLSPQRFNGTRYSELAGYPALFNAFMPDVAANAYPIIFGDFSGYYLINRVGFSIQVLRELYAETNQIVLLARVRFGGLTVEPWRFRVQKVSA